MSRSRPASNPLSYHKPTGQYYVTREERRVYLGCDRDEALLRYHRLALGMRPVVVSPEPFGPVSRQSARTMTAQRGCSVRIATLPRTSKATSTSISLSIHLLSPSYPLATMASPCYIGQPVTRIILRERAGCKVQTRKCRDGQGRWTSALLPSPPRRARNPLA